MPTDEVKRIIKKRSIPAYTDRTLTKPADLVAEVEQVRAQGWAASEQELNENNAVAAPVVGRGDNTELILLALGFAEQLSGDEIASTGELLVKVAKDVRRAGGLEEDDE
jgi:IclR family acetate operon transcriptional repressor